MVSRGIALHLEGPKLLTRVALVLRLPPLKIKSDPTEESFWGEEIELKNSF